jgi:hypothetical protein
MNLSEGAMKVAWGTWWLALNQSAACSSHPFAVFPGIRMGTGNRFTEITMEKELGYQAVSYCLEDGTRGDFPADGAATSVCLRLARPTRKQLQFDRGGWT